ncbi:MAG: aldolase/citrate lyase family protein [Trueperaceae bacterium]
MRDNRTKNKLLIQDVAYGTFTLVPEPSLAELVGAAGYDFIGIDMEHAAADGRTIENMIRASQSYGVTPLVRVREVDQKTILWVLDSGAEGIILPLIEDRASAERAVGFTRYPPLGVRTLCSATRAAGRGVYRDDFSSFVDKVNQEILIVALIETRKGVENIAEIADSGIDVFVVGRADLSMEMGLGYAPHHPSVVEATNQVLTTVMSKGKTAGVLAYSPDEAIKWQEFGCKFIWYSQPEIILATHYRDTLNSLKAANREPQLK